MSNVNLSVPEEVRRFIDDVTSKYDLNPVIEVKYLPGAGVGDGYFSQNVAVNIRNSRESLDLFLKYALKKESSEWETKRAYYANEIHFYDVVYPAYREFSKGRGDETGLRYVPKCYGTSLMGNIVAMEHLNKKGFKVPERSRTMDDVHVRMVLKTLARFHAVSFAFKDQEREKYDELVDGSFDVLSTRNGGEKWMTKLLRGSVVDFFKKLDPIIDKEILDRCDAEDFVSVLSCADRTLDEYSILTKGDCWSSNVMFLSEVDDAASPKDIVLIDWQAIRPASAVFDVSYFFLTVASEETLAQSETYLKFYHEELSKRIRRLGSDPEILYPFPVFRREWRRHSKYALAISTLVIKLMLSEEEEAVDMEDVDFNDATQLQNLFPKFDKEEEFLRRMRILAKYLIANECL